MKKGNILIVDDHKHVLDSIIQILEPYFSTVTGLANPNIIPEVLSKKKIDVVLLDMNYSAGINSGNEGLFWLREIKKKDDSIQVVPISAYGDIDIAVKAIKAGATDFVQKPWENEKLIATLNTALQLRQSKLTITELKNKQKHLISAINQSENPMIGESESMRKLLTTVKKVAVTDANILITGENGTGKGLLVKTIHSLSQRSSQPLVTVDLGAIPESLFESELFGHIKGAFTDAKEDRTGRFVFADKSTLFLDEIGNIPIHLQAKLLSVIQNKQVIAIGSDHARKVDVKLICATNRNLGKMVKDKLFREDLLFRINTIELNVPPLTDRSEDIPILSAHYIRHFSNKYGKEGLRITHDAQDSLNKYSWPGNIRELKHILEKAVILCDGNNIKKEDIFFSEISLINQNNQLFTLEEIEIEAIKKALKANNYKVRETAAQLGVSRQTLYNKMEKYGL